MISLDDKLVVITGATGDIGRAIARTFSERGARLGLIGRNRTALESVVESLGLESDRVWLAGVDFTRCEGLSMSPLLDGVEGIDVLVHGAALHFAQPLEKTPLDAFDRMHAVNVRAPFALTQQLLPALRRARGDVVFLNSSMGKTTRAGATGYAMTKHALRGLADGLRQEVNASGVRVLSVYLGRTAGAIQRALHAEEGRPYCAERLLQPADVATAVANAIGMARTAELMDLDLRPMRKLLGVVNR